MKCKQFNRNGIGYISIETNGNLTTYMQSNEYFKLGNSLKLGGLQNNQNSVYVFIENIENSGKALDQLAVHCHNTRNWNNLIIPLISNSIS